MPEVHNIFSEGSFKPDRGSPVAQQMSISFVFFKLELLVIIIGVYCTHPVYLRLSFISDTYLGGLLLVT